MTIDTKRLRELAEAATPGPWSATEGCAVFADGLQIVADTFSSGADHPGGESLLMPWSQPQCAANAAWVAAANPTTVIAILDDNDRLRAEVVELKREVERLRPRRRLNGGGGI